MDVAALVISIVAVLLSVVVAGWAIYLQWSMFRATTDQLTAIGKENARLGEEVSRSLGQIHEAATGTRGTVESTFLPLVSLLSNVTGQPQRAPGREPAAAAEQAEPRMQRWLIEQAVTVLGVAAAAPLLVEHLSVAPRALDGLGQRLLDLRPEAWDKQRWEWDVVLVVGVLLALGLLDIDREKGTVSLLPAGNEIRARLVEGRRD
jgi:hypothetical protein